MKKLFIAILAIQMFCLLMCFGLAEGILYTEIEKEATESDKPLWTEEMERLAIEEPYEIATEAQNGDIAIDEKNFPDEVFRAYIAENFDMDSNQRLSVNERKAVAEIYLYDTQIASVEGIEFFPNLTKLNCAYNQLSALDVSKNRKLNSLSCENNQLTRLDVSSNAKLAQLWCSDNSLGELDVGKNTKLTSLYCDGNQITDLDVSNNRKLVELHCENNLLTQLDVSKNTRLYYLFCSENHLTRLDVRKNKYLDELHCENNQLESIDLGSKKELKYFHCYNNDLKSLNISQCPLLKSLVNCIIDTLPYKEGTVFWGLEERWHHAVYEHLFVIDQTTKLYAGKKLIFEQGEPSSVSFTTKTIKLDGDYLPNIGKYMKMKPVGVASACTFTSSNEDVCAIDASGYLWAWDIGNVTITVTTANGKEASVRIIVEDY